MFVLNCDFFFSSIYYFSSLFLQMYFRNRIFLQLRSVGLAEEISNILKTSRNEQV